MSLTTTLKSAAASVILCALSSCQAANTPASSAKVDEISVNISPTSSVYTAFSCISPESALVAAHRGTVEGTKLPENALLSLQALHEKGVQFAEIDIAKLKDGTHILFHDGIWDKRSNGEGPIAATNWSYAETLLLNDTNGALTAVRPSRFDDVLAWAKDRIYLEIDFKSSANPKTVINMIRAANMMDQVILIAYTPEQAIELHTLAPKAMISVSIFKTGDLKALQARGLPIKNMAAWIGRGDVDDAVVERLQDNNIPILMGSFFELDDKLQNSKQFDVYQSFAKKADLIVSDFAFDTQQSLDSYKDYKSTYKKCLSEQ